MYVFFNGRVECIGSGLNDVLLVSLQCLIDGCGIQDNLIFDSPLHKATDHFKGSVNQDFSKTLCIRLVDGYRLSEDLPSLKRIGFLQQPLL